MVSAIQLLEELAHQHGIQRPAPQEQCALHRTFASKEPSCRSCVLTLTSCVPSQMQFLTDSCPVALKSQRC